MQENFYLQESSKNDEIFLIGSSQIFTLDENIIEDYLKKNKKDYTVYNLGSGSDDPFTEPEQEVWFVKNMLYEKIVLSGKGYISTEALSLLSNN